MKEFFSWEEAGEGGGGGEEGEGINPFFFCLQQNASGANCNLEIAVKWSKCTEWTSGNFHKT